jgi:hypothetical protein
MGEFKLKRFPDIENTSKHDLASFVLEVLAIAESDGMWSDLEYAKQTFPEFFEREEG